MTGKVKAWLMTMEEDACEMTRKEFIAKHGEHNIDVFECILDQAKDEGFDHPQLIEDSPY